MFYYFSNTGKKKEFKTLDDALKAATSEWKKQNKTIEIEIYNQESGRIAATLQSDEDVF